MARSANIATVVETELLEAPPLREQIYQRLRDAILTGQLPAGTRLSPARLAESFGVSTMPVREALRLLEDDGLIQTSPRRWTRVASPDPGLADEIYPLIGLLEDYALRTAPGAPVEQVQRARQANAALASAANRHDVLACLAADDSFHSVLVDLHPSPALRRTVADLKARTRLLEGAYFRFDDASTSVEEHNAVIDALVRGDMRQAGKSIAANWQHGLQKLRSVLAEPATDASDSRPPAISDPMDLESETLTAGP
jgi:DNA-binding GntR family transcriptional regulator